MKPTSNLAGPGIILLCLFIFSGCNQNNNDNGGEGLKSAFTFDTARAAKSVIPISQALGFQRSFIGTRKELDKLTKDTSYLTRNFNLPNGESFTKDALLLLLSQKGADGIRFYYGKDSKGVIRLVLLPIDKDGKIIHGKLLATSKGNTDTSGANTRASSIGTDDEAVETGQTCPPCLIEQ